MAPPLAELTAQAQTLTSAGDLAGARDVLADALDPADADPQRASPDLALAAALQARILIALGDPHAARIWAGFAHAAEDRLHGRHDERTIAAAATHAAVLHRVGNHGRAAQLYHDLVGELTAADGPLSARVLAAEADLATAEHAAGQCTAARTRLADAWQRHDRAHGEDTPAGIKMLARLAAMERECGLDRDAQQHFSRAQELCARYLPPDHPLGRQVARLAGAAASGRHVCGQVQRSTGPAPDGPAPGVTRVPATSPGVHPVRHQPPAPGDPIGRHARTEPLVSLPPVSPAPDEPVPPVPHHGAWSGPPPPIPAQARQPRPETAAPMATAPPAYRPVAAPPAPPGPWPPDSFPPAAHPAGSYPPGPRLPVDEPAAPPVDRRLPVPVKPRDRRSSRQSLVLAGVLVAGIAAAAAIVVATLPRGHAGPAPGPGAGTASPEAPPTSASAPASARPTNAAVAPTRVTLQDNRDSVALTWRYPKGSEGPVLISGGRAGQELRAFQQLPAGTTDYVVYGLNRRNNYCFSVAVVYTVDQVAASEAVCTKR